MCNVLFYQWNALISENLWEIYEREILILILVNSILECSRF